MANQTLILAKETAKLLLKNETPDSGHLQGLNYEDELYREVEKLIDERLLLSKHSFQIRHIDCASAPKSRSTEFRRRLEAAEDSQLRFLFHGTNLENHESIFTKGFLLDAKHFGRTDPGQMGKGVYLSPVPEYCAAYIKSNPEITTYQYDEPVPIGAEFHLLGCIVIVGAQQFMSDEEIRKQILPTKSSASNARYCYVNSEGAVTNNQTDRFAKEYVVPDPENVYPRFRIVLKRTKHEVVWVDPNITNRENSKYVEGIKATPGIFLYATTDPNKALEALKKKKPGIEYRAVTAGRGGEGFVKMIRGEGITCKVLVFCGTVEYHKPWAEKIPDTFVTASAEAMYSFTTWTFL